MRPSLVRRIERINEGLNRLQTISKLSLSKYLSDRISQLVVERDLHVMIEALLDIGQSIIAEMNWRVPSTYKEIATILYENKVLDSSEKEALEKLAGLRNILVHLYLRVDHELIFKNLNQYLYSIRKILSKLLRYIKEKGLDPELP